MKGLTIKNLTTEIFQGLSFELTISGLYGIIGRNGIGKSTLFSILNQEIIVKSARIETSKLVYVPSLDIFDKHLTANDYVQLLSSEEQARFQTYTSRLGGLDFLNKKIGKYSLGMKELFAFLYTLSLEADVYILDELLDGIDEQKRATAYQLLKEVSQDSIILFTSHNLTEVFAVCDTVYVLDRASLTEVNEISLARELILI